ncbi:MAG: hypothetical protein OXI63_25440 [Candidatus Poribacteria bacterium]|nr:hypothetical protein [Candidatus Poribacteria bacterium]
MPRFIEMTSAPWTKANFRMPPGDDARSTKTSSRSTNSQSPSSVTVNVAGIIFTGSHAYYNRLYDRQSIAAHPSGLNIEPPQWQKEPPKDEPISYVRDKKAGEETISHEIYITYSRSYEAFEPYCRPWKRVLRDACSYAHGAKSIISASSMVATGIYDSLKFRYYACDSHSWYNNFEIKLWEMLSEGWMDCMDGANYWTIMMRWLGISANQIKINEEDHIIDRDGRIRVYHGFYYKTLRPISASDNHTVGWHVRNRTDPNSNWWNFHQVGILGNAQHGTLGSWIYDPIIKINETAPRVPTNMIRDDYKRVLFDPVPYRHPTDPKKDGHGTFPWDKAALVRKVE